MDEIDLSSSDINENEEGLSALQKERNKNAELQVHNQHLEDVIAQMKNSINSLKEQLDEAVKAVSANNNMNEQIQTLQNELGASIEREKNLNIQLKKALGDAENITAKYAPILAELTSAKEKAEGDLHEATIKISKIRGKQTGIFEELEITRNELRTCSDKLQDVKSQKKKIRNKFIGLGEQLQSTESQNSQLNVELNKALSEKTSLSQDIESLKMQISNLEAKSAESIPIIAHLKRDIEVKASTIKILEQNIDTQRHELSASNAEFQTVVGLLQKSHGALAAFENRVEILNAELESVEGKLKSSKKTKNSNNMDFSGLTIPFDGDFGDRAREILKMPQYLPLQRMQLILNEASKFVGSVATQNTALKNEYDKIGSVEQQRRLHNTQYAQILNALMKALKKLTGIETDDTQEQPIAGEDDAFFALVTEKSTEIDPLIREELLSDPAFVPSDIFFTPEMSKRKAVIKEFLRPTDHPYIILCAQFLTNILLRKKLESVLSPLARIQEISNMEFAKGCDIAELPGLVQKMDEKIQSLTATRKNLNGALKKTQAQLNELSQNDSEQKTKLAQLALQNESLQNEIEVLRVKVSVANNELCLKTNECTDLGEFVQQIRANVADQQSETRVRTERLEHALVEKTRENWNLSELIKKLQDAIDLTKKKQAKQAKHAEDSLKKQIETLQTRNEDLEAQLTDRKKLSKRNERYLKDQYDASARELAVTFEESKVALEKTVTDLKEKAVKAREMSQKLMLSINELEERNNILVEENARLVEAQKNVVVQIGALKQQVQKERQHMQSQIAAQTMVYESKVQTTTQALRAETARGIKDVLNMVYEVLSEFYELDEAEFSKDALKDTLNRVKEDLLNLQFFQSQTSHFRT